MNVSYRLALALMIFTAGQVLAVTPDDRNRNDPSAYFDSVTSITSAPSDFFIQVSSVRRGLPADRAGLKAGDSIVGIDGVRVRNLKEYNLIRFFYDQRPAVALTIVRDGKLMALTIPDPKPVRYGGFDMTDHTPRFLAALKSAGILTDDLFPEPFPGIRSAATNDLINLLVEPFLDAEDTSLEPGSDTAIALSSFPARGQEEIIALLATNTPADREWVRGLLKVYGRLLFEKPAEAIRMMNEATLSARQPKPFLGSLLQFYRKVAEHPMSQDEVAPLKAYQVDAHFFALCYPYPITPGTRPYTFPADPTFQDNFSKAFTGSKTRVIFQDELAGVAMTLAGLKEGDPVERYMRQVKAAVLDFENHGGWPYRSALIWSASQSDTMITGLVQRLAQRPEERTEIGLSLIGPSMIAGDEETFRQACGITLEAGPKISALTHWIIDAAISVRGNLPPGHWREIAISTDNARRIPPVYAYLQRTSPGFERRCSAGWSMIDGAFHGDVVGPSSYCFAMPLVVAKALEKPVDARHLPDLAGVPEGSAASDEIEKAAAEWTFVLAFNPDPKYVNAFLKLTPRLGAGKAFDVIRQVIPYHQTLWNHGYTANGLIIKDVYKTFFADVERRHYRETVAALEKLNNDDPELPRKIADLYATAGVPSVGLLLSKKLKEAGHSELSGSYQQRAVDFWDGLLLAFPHDLNAHVWPCRDLASTTGFEEVFDRYDLTEQNGNANLETRLKAMLQVYRAITESYRGQYDATVEELVRSNVPALQTAQVVSLYNGETYPAFAQLRTQLVTDLRKAGRLSAEQELKVQPFLPSKGK